MEEVHEVRFTGNELLRIWEAGRQNGLTQRRLAAYLNVGFNSLHGKIFRAQQKLKTETMTAPLQTYDRVFLKAAVFDIETTDFAASGVNDHLVCTCILPLDSDSVRTVAISFEDNRDDRRVLQETVDALMEYDILIGHNIAAFDLNWLNSRLMYHNMDSLSKRWLYYDTYQVARRLAIKADRKSMAFLCDFFRVPFIKTAVLPVSWSMIDSPDEIEFNAALDDIVFHCQEDVKANRNIFDALWKRDTGLQNLPAIKKW